jgi:hypothetical protein
MVRNTENSDGCSAVVLERMVIDPGPRRAAAGTVTLLPWLNDGRDEQRLPSQPGPEGAPGLQGTYPAFELGSWRFTVKTGDLSLIEELRGFVGEIADLPRADARFTFKLVLCTEEGRLGGWAWQKERVQDT